MERLEKTWKRRELVRNKRKKEARKESRNGSMMKGRIKKGNE